MRIAEHRSSERISGIVFSGNRSFLYRGILARLRAQFKERLRAQFEERW
jgi:hypothetical protein